MASSTNVNETIQELFESLSNSIPTLVLLLLSSQEQAKPPPTELPPLLVRNCFQLDQIKTILGNSGSNKWCFQ